MDINTKIEKMIDYAEYAAKSNPMEALRYIRTISFIACKYNQFLTSSRLEMMMQTIAQQMDRPKKKSAKEEEMILFYDGVGFDTRGLARIYLRALAKLGYKIIYVVTVGTQTSLQTLREDAVRYGVEFVEINRFPLIGTYNALMGVFYTRNIKKAILYTTEWDVYGPLAFINAPEECQRFHINLGDHCFWIGTSAFDYNIEFRDYGKEVSEHYRGIDASKLLKQPYYPLYNEDEKFEGFPFEKRDDMVVLFSGGAQYKIRDKNNTFCRIIRHCLNSHKNLVFWYAGNQPSEELDALKVEYDHRVFVTRERKDLYQIMQNIDIYLNTYPIGGGLMVQYSAAALKPTVALIRDNHMAGILNTKHEHLCFFHKEETLIEELDKLISSKDYRDKRGSMMKDAVISEEDFTDNLSSIIENHESKFPFTSLKPDVETIKKAHKEMYTEKELRRDMIFIGENEPLKELVFDTYSFM